MNSYLKLASGLSALILFTSCQSAHLHKIIAPEKLITQEHWSQEELSRDISIHTLKTTPEASYHLILLHGFEKPHTHNEHDLVVFVLKGKSQVVMADKTFEVKAGDVVEIPRGVVHWAKNLDPVATEVYAVFTPPFDGKDHQVVN